MGSEKTQGYNKMDTTSKKVCFISTISITALLLVYLAVTISSMHKLNSQIRLTTEHPFVVSRYVGEVRTDVAQMRIRTERLQSYNQSADIEKVNNALNKLYKEVEPVLFKIEELYLGPIEDAEILTQTFNKIRENQKRLLEYASETGRTKEQITLYEEECLYPLYDTIEEGAAVILAYTQKTQTTVYESSDALWKTTLIWSITIVVVTISGLFLFQYILGRLNKEIYYKNQLFETLSKTIDETFLIFDATVEKTEFVAENAYRVLGITSEKLIENRKIFYQYIDEDAKNEINKNLCDSSVKLPCETSIKYCHPETCETRWIVARFYKTQEENNPKYIVTVADQTEEVNSRQHLRDALTNANNANNAKRDFLSRMSHEIRTPMNAIIGMTTIAGASMDDRLRVEDCLTKISYSSKHLLMLINDVLDMSRIESNKMSINNEPFDLYQFINSFVSIIYSQAQVKGVEFEEKMIGFSENTTFISDSLRLNQILLNIISNAIKFTPSGGKVTLEVKRFPSHEMKERIRFTVTDTGIGMGKEALKRIFDPFEQADETIAQRFGGTGLGMPITKNLVSLMGGYLDVKSNEGVGTTCTIEMSFDKSFVELETLPQEALTALNVIVVDDEKDVCEHTTLLLTKINIRAKWVLSGSDAVKQVVKSYEEGDGFDICFIDWNMPGMDGIETTRKIRESVGYDTPIIIISSYDWSEIEQEAREAGANAFVSKPLFLSSIYNVLVNVTNGAFAHTAAKKADEKTTLKGRRILVAEDNELNLEIAEEMLKMRGAFVECVMNGQEAVAAFEKSEPGYFDAILMDIQMPVMNGYEATQKIRSLSHEDAIKIPIIATTANAFTEDMSAAIASGMNAHVSKPIDMNVLCNVISKFT